MTTNEVIKHLPTFYNKSVAAEIAAANTLSEAGEEDAWTYTLASVTLGMEGKFAENTLLTDEGYFMVEVRDEEGFLLGAL